MKRNSRRSGVSSMVPVAVSDSFVKTVQEYRAKQRYQHATETLMRCANLVTGKYVVPMPDGNFKLVEGN